MRVKFCAASAALFLACTCLVSPTRGQPFGPQQAAGASAAAPNDHAPPNDVSALNDAAGRGGAANADFDSLIDLIISTVAPDSWAENGGGEAEVRPYVNGVFADAAGVLKRRASRDSSRPLAEDLRTIAARLDAVSNTAAAPRAGDADNPRKPSRLRCVSLGRLEREMERRKLAGEPVDPAMLTLAGLRRVRYVVRLSGDDGAPADAVLAGEAGDWRLSGDGRLIAIDTGEAVVRLDDFLTLARRAWSGSARPFGCSINPRPEALAEAQSFLNDSRDRPVPPRKRDAWLEELRGRVGTQDIKVFGVEPTSRVAGVLVEADHHMKLVGLGLAEGVTGVENYLDALAVQPANATASTGVLRWWFTMHYAAIHANAAKTSYELLGPAARVLSEKQMLTERGQRVAAAADPLAAGFADSFSRSFAALCRKHAVYSELRNVFDLAVAIEILRQPTAAWRPGFFLDSEGLPLPEYEPARVVETVVSHRVVDRRRFVAGVSGGVWGDARQLLERKQQTVSTDRYGPLGQRPITAPASPEPQQWWWDAGN